MVNMVSTTRHIGVSGSFTLRFHRPHPLQDSHPLFYRRKVPQGCRHRCSQQQPRQDGLKSLPPGHRQVRDPKSRSRRSRRRERLGGRLHGGTARLRPRLLHLGKVRTSPQPFVLYILIVVSRSIHNTRIERLWYDVTNGFGQKWKNFFLDLETHHGMNPSIPGHIWLLHHLFLPAISTDAQQWAASWNAHKMNLKGAAKQSPDEMYMFSLIEDGPRGFTAVNDEVVDPATYGVDWDAAGDPTLMAHHLAHNPEEAAGPNAFGTKPANLPQVPCEPPNCPLTAERVRYLDLTLSQQVDVSSGNMLIRRNVWRTAMAICHNIMQS